MNQNMPDISVVVCAYTEERWDDLVTCVASLQSQTIAPKEIVVVIDHNPRLFARASREFHGVTVVENGDQRGLSGARNTGIAAASGSIIAFLDEDALAMPDWLEKLGASYADPQVLGVGGSIVPVWAQGRPEWFPEEFDWVVGCVYRGMPESIAPVRNLIGCNMSFRRDVFAAAGGFRNGIGRVGTRPVGCEETELCIRVRQRWPHGQLLYQPQARVYHRVPANRSRWSYFRSRCYAEGLSKALVARLVGAQDGLASERAYVMRTLPRAVGKGIGDAVLRRDRAGLARAGAIAGGLVLTALGYLIGLKEWRPAAVSGYSPASA